MASKLDKMLGIPRISMRSRKWKDFDLHRGCAFGRDFDGRLYASYGTRADKYGDLDPKPRHIIVFYCINEDTSMPIKRISSVWGSNSVAIGRRPIIVPAGNYSSPWGYQWAPRQVSYDHPLAKAIYKKLNDFHRGCKL